MWGPVVFREGSPHENSDRMHLVRVDLTCLASGQLALLLCSRENGWRQQPSDARPARQNHNVRASIKVTGRAGQRPGRVQCEALALGPMHAAANYWPNADVSVRSLFAQRPVDEQLLLFIF
jgi:hypothetical protein